MNQVDDELLTAYADNELSDDQRREVEAYLQTDEPARTYVASLMRSTRALQQAYDQPMHEAPPQRLVDAIMNPPSNVINLQPKKRHMAWSTISIGLAASLAIVAILVNVGILDDHHPDQEPFMVATGNLDRGDTLSEALENLASGAVMEIGDKTTPMVAQPMLTFLDRQARPCRELEVVQHSTATIDLVIACREPGATWTVEGVYRISDNSSPANNTAFTPAAGAANGASDQLLETLGAGDPVSPQEERRLLDSGWN
jgi:hypothetical protein